MNHLPPPEQPYGLWARLVTAIYEHGKRTVTQALVREELAKITDSIVESYDREIEPPMVRPSGNLACARQAFLLEKHGTEQALPGGLGATFSAGHYFHAMAFAYSRSAVPPGFSLETEVEPDPMPDWWPDRPSFKQTGHQDMVLRITDPDLAARYLKASAGISCLVDWKGMGAWSYRKLCQGDPWEGPDVFGYMAQLAVYSNGGQAYGESVLGGINRDQIWKPVKCRIIPPNILDKEMYRLRKGFDALADGRDPGPEFARRWGVKAEFACGTKTRAGACNQSANCHAEGGWDV